MYFSAYRLSKMGWNVMPSVCGPLLLNRQALALHFVVRQPRALKHRGEVLAPRQVKKNAEWQKPQHEVVYLVSSLPAAASPQALLGVNRDHWRIEIMHRNKDVILGEDGYTNRRDNGSSKHFLPHRLRS